MHMSKAYILENRADYSESQGDLVIWSIMGILGDILWLIGGNDLLAKSPEPSNYEYDVSAVVLFLRLFV